MDAEGPTPVRFSAGDSTERLLCVCWSKESWWFCLLFEEATVLLGTLTALEVSHTECHCGGLQRALGLHVVVFVLTCSTSYSTVHRCGTFCPVSSIHHRWTPC